MSRKEPEQTKDTDQIAEAPRAAAPPVTGQRHHHPQAGEPTEGLKTLYG